MIKKKTAAKTASVKKPAAKKSAAKSISKDVKVIAEAMLDKKAKNVCSLDLRKLGTSICDYFVICNADSTTNVSAIADNVEDQMEEKCNKRVVRAQGKENSFWIIMDYGDIVVHIFQTQYRDFYRLEELWSDCKRTSYED